MPYFPALNLLYLHCPKAAGTSVENACCEASHIAHFNYNPTKALYFANQRHAQKVHFYGFCAWQNREFALQHATWQQLQEMQLIENSEDFLKKNTVLVTVRNPYARAYSEFKWRQLFGWQKSFKEMLQQALQEGWHTDGAHHGQHFLPQTQFFAGLEHSRKLYVAKIEQSDKLNQLLQQFGIPSLQRANTQQQNSNNDKTNSDDWRQYYDEECAQLVQKMYADDFSILQYGLEWQ